MNVKFPMSDFSQPKIIPEMVDVHIDLFILNMYAL